MKKKNLFSVFFLMLNVTCFAQLETYDSICYSCIHKMNYDGECKSGYKPLKQIQKDLLEKDEIFFYDLNILLGASKYDNSFKKIIRKYKRNFFYRFETYKKVKDSFDIYQIDFYTNYTFGHLIFSVENSQMVTSGIWLQNNYRMLCNNDTLEATIVRDYQFYRDYVFPHFKKYYKPQKICGDFFAGNYDALQTLIWYIKPTREKRYD